MRRFLFFVAWAGSPIGMLAQFIAQFIEELWCKTLMLTYNGAGWKVPCALFWNFNSLPFLPISHLECKVQNNTRTEYFMSEYPARTGAFSCYQIVMLTNFSLNIYPCLCINLGFKVVFWPYTSKDICFNTKGAFPPLCQTPFWKAFVWRCSFPEWGKFGPFPSEQQSVDYLSPSRK